MIVNNYFKHTMNCEATRSMIAFQMMRTKILYNSGKYLYDEDCDINCCNCLREITNRYCEIKINGILKMIDICESCFIRVSYSYTEEETEKYKDGFQKNLTLSDKVILAKQSMIIMLKFKNKKYYVYPNNIKIINKYGRCIEMEDDPILQVMKEIKSDVGDESEC